jgi:adenosylcobinamide-phosphate synthase
LEIPAYGSLPLRELPRTSVAVFWGSCGDVGRCPDRLDRGVGTRYRVDYLCVAESAAATPLTKEVQVGFPARAAGLVVGYAADLAFADPRRGHPVAGFGLAASALERACWADERRRGAVYTGVLVGGIVALGWVAERATRGRPAAEAAIVAVATWVVLGGRSLAREGSLMAQMLENDDLPGARDRLGHLCARDATGLAANDLARASVESLAENTSDAVVAPLLWGAVAGVPGLLGYRAVNTLDAMVGYRSERFVRFGWASARLDDVVNLVPARVAAALTVTAAPLVGGRSGDGWRVWRRDASRHPSPNAGVVEAASAGALGVSVGGLNTYDGSMEDRGILGDGPAVAVADLSRSVRLSQGVSFGALLVAVGVAVARRGRG